VRLAKGEKERLVEEDQPVASARIARSVNIQIDKLSRHARGAQGSRSLLGRRPRARSARWTARRDPLPSRQAIAISTPSARAPPPPSEFPVNEGAGAEEGRRAGSRSRSRPSKVAVAPPLRAAGQEADATADEATGALPRRRPRRRSTTTSSVRRRLREAPAAPASGSSEESYFRESSSSSSTEEECGEPTAGLTFAKFGDKLRKNKEELVQKTGCREVRFTVYVKDGKAALKGDAGQRLASDREASSGAPACAASRRRSGRRRRARRTPRCGPRDR